MVASAEVLRFWIDEIGEAGWYAGGAEIDRACKERFGAAWQAAHGGAYREWLGRPEGSLAYLILTDQLSRNIGRGSAQAFATDRLALSAAALAVKNGQDLAIEGVQRQFFYLPFEHAESTAWQDRSVRLFLTRMPKGEGGNLVHAIAHREIIRRFGRFPFRNAALGRASSREEERFLSEEGYGGVIKRLEAEAMHPVQGGAAEASLLSPGV